MEFKAYHKIRQFKDVVRDIQFKSNFKGMDDEGQPIYEESKKPILTFTATTKLHGTNAGVCYDLDKGVMAQKRGSLLKKEDLASHFGFNQFVQVEKKEYFEDLMQKMHKVYCKEHQQITIYGEWAGLGIQKGVGISELPKGFYIFDCKIHDVTTNKSEWIDISDLIFETDKVFNIYDFPTWNLEIDFNRPAIFQNQLIEITEQIEKECPVSKQLGVNESVGEGAVWTCHWNGDKYIFKVKGDAHAGKSKVKQLKPVDNEKLQKINETVSKLTPVWRLNQKITDVFKLNEGGFLERRKIGEYIKSVIKDIIEEEVLTIKESEIDFKELTKPISVICKNYFFEQERVF